MIKGIKPQTVDFTGMNKVPDKMKDYWSKTTFVIKQNHKGQSRSNWVALRMRKWKCTGIKDILTLGTTDDPCMM